MKRNTQIIFVGLLAGLLGSVMTSSWFFLPLIYGDTGLEFLNDGGSKSFVIFSLAIMGTLIGAIIGFISIKVIKRGNDNI